MDNDIKLLLFEKVSLNRLVVKDGHLVKLHWYNVISRFIRWINKDAMDALVLSKIIDVFKQNHYDAIDIMDEIGDFGQKRFSIENLQFEHINKLVNNTAIPVLASRVFHFPEVNQEEQIKSLVTTKDEKVIRIEFSNQIFEIEEKCARRAPLIANILDEFDSNNLENITIPLSRLNDDPLIDAQSIEDALLFLSDRKFLPQQFSRRVGMIATLDVLLVDIKLLPPLITTKQGFQTFIQDPLLISNFLELWCRNPQLPKNLSAESMPFNLFAMIDPATLSSGKALWIYELCQETLPPNFCISPSGNIQLGPYQYYDWTLTEFSIDVMIKILNRFPEVTLEVKKPLYSDIRLGVTTFYYTRGWDHIYDFLKKIKNSVLFGSDKRDYASAGGILEYQLVKKADLLGTNQLNGSNRFEIKDDILRYSHSAITENVYEDIPITIFPHSKNCKMALGVLRADYYYRRIVHEFDDFASLSQALQSSPTLELETLEIENLKLADLTEILFFLGKKAPKLKRLVIKSHPSGNCECSVLALSELLKDCKDLETLSLQGANWFLPPDTDYTTLEEMEDLVKGHPKLQELDLSKGNCVSPLFEMITKRLQNPQTGLKILRISGDLSGNSDAFKQFLQAAKECGTLEELDLRHIHLISAWAEQKMQYHLQILNQGFPKTYDEHLVEGLKANVRSDLLKLFKTSHYPLIREFLESDQHLETIRFDPMNPKYLPPNDPDWVLEQRIGWAANY